MSSHAAAVHSVHIYNDTPALISRLCGIVSSSLQVGDAVLVVATPEHRTQLVEQLQRSGVDLRNQARERLYTMVDADEMLRTFMLNGMPDRELFMARVGEVLADSRNAARSKSQGLTVFGEMVTVLWDEGKKKAAFELERLWNDVLHDRAFHLHCAYPRMGFVNDHDLAAVCSSHSHVV